MNRQEYVENEVIKDFIDWSADHLKNWEKKHSVSGSKHSPAFTFDVVGVEMAYEAYIWKSGWIDPIDNEVVASSDAITTENSLQRLSNGLRSSLYNRNSELHLGYCLETLKWGGVPRTGYFYEKLHADNNLIEYHEKLHDPDSGLLIPNIINTSKLNVKKMSSGITKVHALLSNGYLPIYDSRVAATLMECVSTFCVYKGYDRVPQILLMACGKARNKKLYRIPNQLHGQRYPNLFTSPPLNWMRYQVFSGWLMEGILDCYTDYFFHDQSLETRMNRFQMAFFMMGYNLENQDEITLDEEDDTDDEFDCAATEQPPIDHEDTPTEINYEPRGSSDCEHLMIRGKAIKGNQVPTVVAGLEARFNTLFNWVSNGRQGGWPDGIKKEFGGRDSGNYLKFFNRLGMAALEKDDLKLMMNTTENYMEQRIIHLVTVFPSGSVIPKELVDVYICGCIGKIKPEAQREFLRNRGYAGKGDKSSNNLRSVGKAVGNFFGLLDSQTSGSANPTDFFHEFF